MWPIYILKYVYLNELIYHIYIYIYIYIYIERERERESVCIYLSAHIYVSVCLNRWVYILKKDA